MKPFESWKVRVLAGVAVATVLAATVGALGTGQSFSPATLEAPYQQELYAATDLGTSPIDDSPIIFGGVAFAPNGDPWVSDCVFENSTLHRFAKDAVLPPINLTSTLHPEAMTVPTPGGCGLTNNQDGFLYSNSQNGVIKLNANTGAAEGAAMGLRGSSLGITSDPKTGHVIYVGATCHPSLLARLQLEDPEITDPMDPLYPDPMCKIYDLDQSTLAAPPTIFAQFPRTDVAFVDGIYFDPTGTYLFVTNRDVVGDSNSVLVVRRPEDVDGTHPLIVHTMPAPAGTEPDGVAFHATQHFAVTNDEEGDSMTKFSFPEVTGIEGSYAVTNFALGGFRGDLLNVGPDNCIYATQGPHSSETDRLPGTRYDDFTETPENSLVRICAPEGTPGFAPGPGVTETTQAPLAAHLTIIKHVVNDNGGTAPASAFALTASGTAIPGSSQAVTGAEAPGVTLTVNAGAFSVTEVAADGYTQTGADGCTGMIALGEDKTCTITNDDQPGALIVNKIVINDNGGAKIASDFAFSVNGGSAVPFIQNGTDQSIGSNMLTVNAGTYSVVEANVPVAGYATSYSNCSNVVVPNGGTKTCTITNDDQPAHLTVIKHVVNNNGGAASAGAWTMNVTGSHPSMASFPGAEAGTTITLDAGTFSVAESGGPSGYTQTNAVGCASAIALGETKTCTITNDDQAGTLIVKKVVINDNGGTKIASNFAFSVNGGSAVAFSPAGSNTLTVNAGTYSVVEAYLPVAGYTTTYNNCSGVVVSNGGTATCTVTNDDQPGSISGFVYKDLNRNSVRNFPPELGIGNVTVTLTFTVSGSPTTRTTVTAADGSYSFTGLTGGLSYSISSPTPVAGLPRTTPSPLTVALAVGQVVTDRNFGYSETTAPVCAVFGSANPPYMTYQDAGGGIVRLDVTTNLNSNFRVTITPAPTTFVPGIPAQPYAMPTGTVATYSTPTNALITVSAVRINTSMSAQLTVKATDAFGNIVSCDPIETTVTKLRHERGSQTFTNIPYDEHVITIENGNPGLRAMDVIVNGVTFPARNMDDNEVRVIDVKSAMHRRRDNTITLVPRGRPGDSADVTISDH